MSSASAAYGRRCWDARRISRARALDIGMRGASIGTLACKSSESRMIGARQATSAMARCAHRGSLPRRRWRPRRGNGGNRSGVDDWASTRSARLIAMASRWSWPETDRTLALSTRRSITALQCENVGGDGDPDHRREGERESPLKVRGIVAPQLPRRHLAAMSAAGCRVERRDYMRSRRRRRVARVRSIALANQAPRRRRARDKTIAEKTESSSESRDRRRNGFAMRIESRAAALEAVTPP